ncbi:MAG: YceH family protein [Nitrospirota bacterium]|nr:YceH family protein [Nitrospirota bacterium]
MILNDIEVRILGCLIEKQITTPDYYPLTLNALTNACNQKSNRDPVVSFDETTVVRGLDGLHDKGFSEKIYKADSRVPKYQHTFREKLNLTVRETAVMCELMLRGPQTIGEVKGRAERMYKFSDLAEVEGILDGLMNREEPLVTRLPRQAGRKEPRHMHLLSGAPEVSEIAAPLREEAATMQVRSENERIGRLEDEITALRGELEELRKAFLDLKAQLE